MPDKIVAGENDSANASADEINDDIEHLPSAAVDKELVIFIGESKSEAETKDYKATEKIFAVAEDDATDGQEKNRQNTIDCSMGKFAQRCVDQCNGERDIFFVQMGVSDLIFVGDIENFEDGLFDDGSASIVGIS